MLGEDALDLAGNFKRVPIECEVAAFAPNELGFVGARRRRIAAGKGEQGGGGERGTAKRGGHAGLLPT
jgi:hypothetical protein